MGNGLSAFTGLTGGEMLQNDAIRRFSTRLGSEAIRVGQALGYQLEEILHMPPETIARAGEGDGRRCTAYDEQRLRTPGRAAAEQRPSMGQDMLKGRRTEIEFLNGFVVREGEKLGLACPANTALTDIVLSARFSLHARRELGSNTRAISTMRGEGSTGAAIAHPPMVEREPRRAPADHLLHVQKPARISVSMPSYLASATYVMSGLEPVGRLPEMKHITRRTLPGVAHISRVPLRQGASCGSAFFLPIRCAAQLHYAQSQRHAADPVPGLVPGKTITGVESSQDRTRRGRETVGR